MAAETIAISPILPSKLRPPRVPGKLVDRSHLLRRKGDALTRVTIIVAPAGFGKTTLLAQWIDACGEPSTWLSADTEDNALARFIESIIGTLALVDPELGARVQQRMLAYDEPGIRAYQEAALYEVARDGSPWTLVIDDYHLITNPEVHGFVNRLIAALPAGCRLIIATRTEPPLPTARMRVHGELTMLNADDLRATLDEARLLFRWHDVHALGSQSAAAHDRVGGWMLGLHLIAHAAKARSIDEILDTLTTFDEDMDLLNEFLLQEVLDQQEPELRAFLLQISIMDRFTDDACFATTHEPATRLFLDRIRRRGLFLVDLDEAGTWHRFHHVFQDFLRRRLLVETDPRVVRMLYADASRWHAEHGLTSAAITFALAAEEWQTASALINSAASDLIFKHRLAELFAWMRKLPAEIVLSDPNLSTVVAYGLTRDGRAEDAMRYLDAAERIWQAEGFSNGLAIIEMNRAMAGRFRGQWSVLLTSAANGVQQAPGERALDADGRLADVHPKLFHLEGTWREREPQADSYLHLALALLYLGRIQEAETLVRRLQGAWTERGYNLAAIPTGALIPMLYLAQGRLELAETFARPLAEPLPEDRPTERALSVAVLAEVLYEWDRLDEAEQVLHDGLEMLQTASAIGASEPLHMLLARVLWIKGDRTGVFRELDTAAEAAGRLQNPSYTREAEALSVQYALASGNRERARRWVIRQGLAVDGDIASATMTEWLVFARVLIATDEAELALHLLARLREITTPEGYQHHLIKVLVLQSLAYLDVFDLDRAVDTLSEALALAEEGRYLRAFIDEGMPMVRLLRITHRRGASVRYIRDLLEAVGEAPEEVVRFAHQQLVEPISSREIQVLGLIALGLTNKEISEELYLAVATVKRHVTNLFGKLGVSNRTDAVHLARKLRLLSEEPHSVSEPPASAVS